MKIKSNLTLKHLGKETILFGENSHNVDYSEVISLNETAASLIEQYIEREFTAEEWAETLVEKYQIEKKRAQNDVSTLIEKMRRLNLIED